MHYSLPLEQMTTEDKIRTMEELWDDLCRRSADIVFPSWHHDVLAEREVAVRVGEAAFEEWGTAKQRVLKRTRRSFLESGTFFQR